MVPHTKLIKSDNLSLSTPDELLVFTKLYFTLKLFLFVIAEQKLFMIYKVHKRTTSGVFIIIITLFPTVSWLLDFNQ